MTKIFLIIFITIFTFSCSEDYHMRKPRFTPNKYKTKRKDSGYSYRIKPSESMQLGIAKENKTHTQPDYYEKRAKDNDGLVEVLDENDDNVGYFKIGNPYEVQGISYVPQNYEDFEEIGIASWYGDDFHGKATANGETYDMRSLTAAHPTLPLPSIVKVTNLENGKTAIVRVNDRGPFAKNRIIDLSQRTAETLGFRHKGTAKVKIELLRNDTDELLKKIKARNL